MTRKIVVCTTVHHIFDQRIYERECRSLADRGYDVTLIGVNHKCEKIADRGIKIVELEPTRTRFARLIRLPKVLSVLLNAEADAYHLHDPELLIVGMFLRLFGKKVIYDVHEYYSEQIKTKYWLPSILRNVVSLCWDCYEKLICRWLAGIVVVNEHMKHAFRACSKVVVLPNYPRRATASDGSAVRFPYRASSRLRLVYAGGIYEGRGIDQLLKALGILREKYNREVEFIMIGAVEPATYNVALTELIKRYGLEGQVTVTGEISHELVREHYLKSSVGIVLDYPELRNLYSVSVKVFEYMSCGLMVMASNLPANMDLIASSNCGITVDPMNPHEIAANLLKLTDDAEEVRRIGLRARKAFEEKYNWEKVQCHLNSFYDNILEGYE